MSKTNSTNAYAPDHSVAKKLRICLDLRDLNEALEREPTRSVWKSAPYARNMVNLNQS